MAGTQQLKRLLGVSPLLKHAIHDRVIGTLFGSALGDSIGLYTEFLSKELCVRAYPHAKFSLIEPTTPFRVDGHRNKFDLRSWTDDTDHSILLLLAYLNNNDGTIPTTADFAARLKIWVQQGLRCLDTLPLGLGATVGRVVLDKNFLEDPQTTAYKHWVTTGYHNAANGSLMRTHPVALMCLDKSPEETFIAAAEISMVTHPDPRCIISCAISVGLIRGIILGEINEEQHIDQLIDQALAWYKDWRAERMKALPEDDDRREDPPLNVKEFQKHVNVETLSDLELDDSQKMGYVYKALGCAVLLLRQAMRKKAANPNLVTDLDTYESLVTPLTMEGGDADTNACIAGAVLGAHLGYKSLPPHWRDGLSHGPWLYQKCEAMCQIIGVTKGLYDGKEDPDTAPAGGRPLLTEAEMNKRLVDFTEKLLIRDRDARAKENPEKESRLKSLFSLRK